MVVKECKIKRNRVPLFPVYDPCFSILLFSYINPFIMFNSKMLVHLIVMFMQKYPKEFVQLSQRFL